MTNRLYLDYAATTPVREEVLAAMMPFFAQSGYNASSVHMEGRAAKAALDDARERVARVLKCKAKEVVFTGGGSEADTLAILGTARAARSGRKGLVSLPTEHHAVLHALDAAADEGFEPAIVPVDSNGLASEDLLARAVGEQTLLVTVMLANNELGVVQPVAALADRARRAGALFHTDAVQAAQYLDVDVQALGVDLMSLAAHKFYGPKGIGVLYVRQGTPIKPLIHGGSQEFGKRAGTENVAAAVGLATALELAAAERDEAAARVRSVRDAFEQRILARIPDVRINGSGAPRTPHVSNISILGVDSEQLLMRLDLDGVAVSAGSACASGAIEPSHVIAALHLAEEWTRGVLRFSFGRSAVPGEAERAAEILEQAVAELRSVSACF